MLVAVDTTALVSVIFGRVYQDAAGQPIRDVLTAALASPAAETRIVHAATLNKATPPPPFLAFRRGPMPTIERSIIAAYAYWYLYASPEQMYWDINTLIKPFATAYNAAVHPLIFNGAPLGQVDMLIGEERADNALHLLMTQITLTVYC